MRVRADGAEGSRASGALDTTRGGSVIRGEAVFEISVIDMPHTQRLIDFISAVDDHAHAEVDLTLKELVEECRDDLARMWDAS
jgi:hypothetical protein